MPTSRRAATSLAALSVLSLALAGCTGTDDAPSPAPRTTAGPAPATTTATAATATTPAAATTPSPAAPASPASGLESPRPAPPLEGLVNADGTPFSLADYAGSPTLVFFGYTHCPDVCPATIGEIFGVFQAAPGTQAVFVSVDPERDTPEWLAKWTEYFPEDFHGVTGSPGAIRRAADGYGVKYARVETSSKAGYTMSHTANVYLIDGDGQLRRTYPFGTPAADMAADISTLRAG